ncbi:N-acetylmuramoyl-L-alanine amidase [Frigidibacter mobilis]|uniref:N-acetylmuramoyl-L-alanine amidase n=1 Tax=Frigidibacter mobilis TaxID=1335048 RepID=A0A159Z4A5_9RHOB|nr:N-acetylmuramoyl-L-alanine amidase [Frigidibacter mobilis]AMY69094.1 N-acetylmuramoyl-L-alanine amidase AmiC [Frigidibacter mobilis]
MIGYLLGRLIPVLAALMLALPVAAQELTALARLNAGTSGVEDRAGGISVTLALSQPVPFRVFLLQDPPRLVVDFREVSFQGADPLALDRSGHVTELRWGVFRPGWSRLVAELDGPFLVSSAWQETDPASVRIRLEPTDAAGLAAVAADPGRAVAGTIWDLPDPVVTLPPKRRQRGDAPLVVVLDPGHGGLDPGAEAAGLTEAHLMLVFARELQELLLRGGMQVVLTRNEDVFVPLETRISIARAAGADLFLSLHADALAEGEAVGATIYTLSEAASDSASARLAERHDRADLLAGIDLGGHDDQVAQVLMELARTETQPRADRLAKALADAIRAAGLKTHRHPVQAADFSVLKSPDIPSVLLEVGFMSSAADRARLMDEGWRAQMQAALLAAIRAWAEADAAEARLIRQ